MTGRSRQERGSSADRARAAFVTVYRRWRRVEGFRRRARHGQRGETTWRDARSRRTTGGGGGGGAPGDAGSAVVFRGAPRPPAARGRRPNTWLN